MSAASDSLYSVTSNLSSDSFENDTERSKCRLELLKALARIETPWESTLNHVWTWPALTASIKTCIDAQLFKKWNDDTGATPKTGAELAQLTGMDPILLRRLLRHMAANNVIHERGEDIYALTPFAKALAVPGCSNAFNYFPEFNGPGYLNLPRFLASISYQNPTDIARSNWQSTTGSSENFFEHMASNPKFGEDFAYAMSVNSASKPRLHELYDTDTLIAGWKRDGAPLLVDVGGGRGQDLEALAAYYPDLPSGSLVLQDLEAPVKEARASGAVKAEVHDFFQPQTIRGARAYYLHIVLHDWPDSKAAEILRLIADAMVPGYSKLLLHEIVIAASDPHPQTTTSDLMMMMGFSAAERTEATWHTLLGSVGLQITKIWRSAATECVIEAEKI